MRTLLPALILFPLLGGCSSSGIWLLQIKSPTDQTQVCEDSVTHNFNGAEVPAEDDQTGPYTSEESTTRSDNLIFANFDLSDSKDATMIIGDMVYPGSKGDGEWIFTWTDEQKDVQRDSHTAGYTFTANITVQFISTFKIDFKGDTATGSASTEAYVNDVYTESDTWSNQVAKIVGDTGQIPAEQYLIIPRGKGGGTPATNQADNENCSGGTCNLNVEESCSTVLDLTATRSGYEDDEAWDALQNDQDPGR